MLNFDSQNLGKQLENFVASPGWTKNFKNRFNLVFRSQTSTHKMLENYQQRSVDFVMNVVVF